MTASTPLIVTFAVYPLAIVVASWLDRAPPAAVQATHDAVQAELRATGY